VHVRDMLVPRIKHLAFGRALRSQGIPADQMPVIEPLAGELEVTYAFDLPDQFRMASPAALRQAGVEPRQVRAVASENLRRRLGPVQVYSRGGVDLVVTGEDLEACLLLVEPFWSETQARLGPEFAVCVPRRDRLLISHGLDAEALDATSVAAREFHAERNDAHALSLQLMVRRDGGWTVHGS